MAYKILDDMEIREGASFEQDQDTPVGGEQALRSREGRGAAGGETDVGDVASATTAREQGRASNPMEAMGRAFASLLTPGRPSGPSASRGDVEASTAAGSNQRPEVDDPVTFVPIAESPSATDGSSGLGSAAIDSRHESEKPDEPDEHDGGEGEGKGLSEGQFKAVVELRDTMRNEFSSMIEQRMVHERLLLEQGLGAELRALHEENEELRRRVRGQEADVAKAIRVSKESVDSDAKIRAELDGVRLVAGEAAARAFDLKGELGELHGESVALKAEVKKVKDEFPSGGGASPPESKFFVDAMRSIEGSMSAMAKRMASGEVGDGKPKKLDFHDYPLFSFMAASKAPSLEGSITAVTVDQALCHKPNRDIKADVAMVAEMVKSDKLLEHFKDDVTTAGYLEVRRMSVLYLAGMGFMLVEKEGEETAESTVQRYLLQSIRYFSVISGYGKLAAVDLALSAVLDTGDTITAGGIYEFMDKEFVAPTRGERNREFTRELDSLTVAQGCLPTTMLSRAHRIYMRKYGDAKDAHKLAEQETRDLVTSSLAKQSEQYGFLKVFSDKLLDADFSAASFGTWQQQFKIYEGTDSFKVGMAAAKKTAAVKPPVKLTGKEVGGPGSRDVNMLLGHHPGELDGSGTTESLQKIMAMIAGLHPGDVGGGAPAGGVPIVPGAHGAGGLGGGGEGDAFLQRMIAAVQFNGASTQVKNDSWVAAHGVPGFKSPSAPDREKLHIGKLAKALGVEVPAGCPKDPNAYVGPNCLCNTWKQIPEENWYWAPESDEFKSGKPEYARVKPADVTKFGYYHKLGKCKACRQKAHELVREDPTKIQLLWPLSKDAVDCITLE